MLFTKLSNISWKNRFAICWEIFHYKEININNPEQSKFANIAKSAIKPEITRNAKILKKNSTFFFFFFLSGILHISLSATRLMQLIGISTFFNNLLRLYINFQWISKSNLQTFQSESNSTWAFTRKSEMWESKAKYYYMRLWGHTNISAGCNGH